MMEPRILTNSEDWLDVYERDKAEKLILRFRKWADKNPAALSWMHDQAYEYRSAKGLFEGLRDYRTSSVLLVDDGSGFKLGNDYTALMARILIDRFPDLARKYKTKKSIFDLLEPESLPRFDVHGKLVWNDAE